MCSNVRQKHKDELYEIQTTDCLDQEIYVICKMVQDLANLHLNVIFWYNPNLTVNLENLYLL